MVYSINENPLNSMMYYYGPAKDGADMLQMSRLVICSGAFGGSSLKQLELYLTHPQGLTLEILGSMGLGKARKRFQREGREPKALAQKIPGGWTVGDKQRCENSSEYPEELAEAFFRLAEASYKRYRVKRSTLQADRSFKETL